MKKIFIALCLLVATAPLFAQVTLPNNSFENWEGGSFSSFSYTHPSGWTTALVGNVTTEVFGVTVPIPVTVAFGEKVSDAHSGSFALKLKANQVGIPGYDQYTFTCPGIAQLGTAEGFSIPLSTITSIMGGIDSTFDFSNLEDLASLTQLVAPGDACTSTPAALRMWVKYLPAEGDQMSVVAYTKLNGAIVANASFSTGETMNEYTQIEAYFDNPLAACDTLGIMIMSGGANTSESTELYVDDVELAYNVGITTNETARTMVFPNPATEYLYVEPNTQDVFNLQLIDLTGRVVAALRGVVGQQQINVSGMAPGVYMLKVESKDNVLTRKVVVR